MVNPRIVMPVPVTVTVFVLDPPLMVAVPCPSRVIRRTSSPISRFSLQVPLTQRVSPGFSLFTASAIVF